MPRKLLSWLAVALLIATSGFAIAQHEEHGGSPPRGEPHPGPQHYQRVTEPHGWNARPPSNFNRADYQHNFQAARVYHIGPYRPPVGWAPHRWVYGVFA